MPFTPGSATDVAARALAAVMTKNLGQTVIVENKPGAGGTIGAGQVAKSAPDGYTLLANSSAHTVNPAIYPNMTYRHGEGSAGGQPARRAAQHHGRLAVEGLEDRGRLREGGEGGSRASSPMPPPAPAAART